MHIRFLDRRVVQDELRGTPRQTVFEKDSIHDLPESSAHRWIQRGVAIAAPKPETRPRKTASAEKD